jgi:chemotaxis protein MotB
MARRKKHEEHANHEAWAIPYGDLITLLLAFFVVMYAVSSVNEGKYRVLSDALVAAFRGAPKTVDPVQVGTKQTGSGADIKVTLVQERTLAGQPNRLLAPVPFDSKKPVPNGTGRTGEAEGGVAARKLAGELEAVAREVEAAMAGLVMQDLLVVRRKGGWIEVEIKTDVLFASGSAELSPTAIGAIAELAKVLRKSSNPIRVEGHTDNVPISTRAFPSNWELSAARAASVVHLLAENGVDPSLLAVLGFAEFRPATENDTEQGRRLNRRVLLVILGGPVAS